MPFSLTVTKNLASFPKAQPFNNFQGLHAITHAHYPNQARPQNWTGSSVTH